MKKDFTLQALCAGLSLGSLPIMAQQAAEKPNILVILGDDMAVTELSCYGGQNLKTSNIDKLAEEGLRMTNNFASCAMSVPIRASLYTGLYPARHGSYQNHKASYNSVKSVSHYLLALGYRVGRTGKDHPVNQPKVYGFEKIPGFTVSCVASHPDPATADGITEFMQRNDEEPFCLFVCSINSHKPWDAGDASEFDPAKVVLPPNCVDNAKTRSEFCDYLAEIRLLDNEVGMVMNALKASGKDENTLVIFLSEQGPQLPFAKWTCYRYGQASALIARYPGKIAAGQTCDALVQYEDILPTLIEFAGGEPIPTLDGVSQLDVLYGQSDGVREWVYGIHNNIPEGPSYPIRSIQDKRYKLIVNLQPEAEYYEKHMMVNGNNIWTSWLTSAKTDEKAKWLTEKFVKRPAVEFYDLQEDPWELNNLADEPQYAERIATMREELNQWMVRQGDRGVLMDTENPEDPALKTPIAINNYEDIDRYIRNDLNGNYYLTNDIEIPEGTEWVPIGASDEYDSDPLRFKGILDGRGHAINGMTIKTESSFKGLFGRMDNGTVKNLELRNVNIKGKAPVGGVTGAMIGSSTIEHVAVTGSIESGSEAGGIAGRVARDANHTDYNVIHDCYVAANVKATNLSTNLNSPSCAGGIVGFIHSNTNEMVAKLDIARTYFSGTVSSAQMNHIAGCAAGILAFTDQNPNVRMNEVLVLADEITGATPNYFYSRRLPAAPNNVIEYMNGLYVRSDLSLSYLSDVGVGGVIPAGIITKRPDSDFRSEQFYHDNLTWDFNNIWTINEGEYPKFKKNDETNIKQIEDLTIKRVNKKSNYPIYDLQGRRIAYAYNSTLYTLHSTLKKGVYIVNGKKFIIAL